MRMDRRAGLLSISMLPALKDLFANTNYVKSAKRSSSSSTMGAAGSLTISVSDLTQNTPYYVFYVTGNNIEIAKIVYNGSSVTRTRLKYVGSRFFTVSGTTLSSDGNIYTGSFNILRFPNYSAEKIDAALSTLTLTLKAGTYRTQGQDTTTVGVASTAIVSDQNTIYLSSFVGPTAGTPLYMSFSAGSTILTALSSSGGTSYAYLYYLSNSTQYVLSINGTSNRLVYGGGIYQLSY